MSTGPVKSVYFREKQVDIKMPFLYNNEIVKVSIFLAFLHMYRHIQYI